MGIEWAQPQSIQIQHQAGSIQSPNPHNKNFQTQAAAAHVTTLPPHALTDDDRLALYAWYKIAAGESGGGGIIGPSSAR